MDYKLFNTAVLFILHEVNGVVIHYFLLCLGISWNFTAVLTTVNEYIKAIILYFQAFCFISFVTLLFMFTIYFFL